MGSHLINNHHHFTRKTFDLDIVPLSTRYFRSTFIDLITFTKHCTRPWRYECEEIVLLVMNLPIMANNKHPVGSPQISSWKFLEWKKVWAHELHLTERGSNCGKITHDMINLSLAWSLKWNSKEPSVQCLAVPVTPKYHKQNTRILVYIN